MTLILNKIFENLVNQILFGNYDPEKIPRIEGKDFNAALNYFLGKHFIIMRDAFTALTKALNHKLMLNKDSRELPILK